MGLAVGGRVVRLIAVILVVLAGAGPAAAANTADLEAQVLALINAERDAVGCSALTLNSALQASAAGHSRAMAVKNFFSHTGKNGSTLRSRARGAGYAGRKLAENIANGQKSAEAVVAAWMGSKGHRVNILNCAYQDTGIALTYQEDDEPLPGKTYAPRYYWVQDFGR